MKWRRDDTQVRALQREPIKVAWVVDCGALQNIRRGGHVHSVAFVEGHSTRLRHTIGSIPTASEAQEAVREMRDDLGAEGALVPMPLNPT